MNRLLTTFRQGVARDLESLARAFVPGAGAVSKDQEVWGIDPALFSPTEYGDYIARSNAVFTCIKLRATLLSSLPLDIYKLKANASRTEVTKGDLRVLLQKVNPFWTFGRLISMTEMSLGLWGSSYWFLHKEGGKPKEIWWARSDRVKVVPSSTGYLKGFLFQPRDGMDWIPFTPEETVWLRYPNPLDEFSGLAPLAAARLAADTNMAAAHHNALIFKNGIQLGGMVTPAQDNMSFSETQARELERSLDKRFKGQDKAHRWAVVRANVKFQPLTLSPKDAQFLEQMKWGLEEICRAFGIPLDLIGGQRTFENVQAAERVIWNHTIKPEAKFIAEELTEQLLPMFPSQADIAEFNFGDVEVLKEDLQKAWTISKEKINTGVLLINEYREEEGQEPVAWGDAWWAPISLTPVRDADQVEDLVNPPDPPVVPPEGDPSGEGPQDPPQGGPEPVDPEAGRIAFGGQDHQRLIGRFNARTRTFEPRLEQNLRSLFRRQQQATITRLRSGSRTAEEVVLDPFDVARWTRTFREENRGIITESVNTGGSGAIEDMGLGLAFDIVDPEVVRAIEARTQKFATSVNETTYSRLKTALAEGVTAGEGIDALAGRVNEVFAQRSTTDAQTIARTEVIGAANTGILNGFRQSGVVDKKEWLAAIDERTRSSHTAAHGQQVGINDDFTVGSYRGQAPGALGAASEDINCRCTIIPVLDIDRLLANPAPAAPSPVEIPKREWQPKMSREEAAQYLAQEGSSLAGRDFYHYTHPDSRSSIDAEGLRTSHGIYDNWIYQTSTPDPEGTGREGVRARYTTAVMARNVYGPVSGPMDLYLQSAELRKRHNISADAPLNEVFRQAGYDGVLYNPNIDGTGEPWLMVQDTKQIILVDYHEGDDV